MMEIYLVIVQNYMIYGGEWGDVTEIEMSNVCYQD
jgi:hypothetical protein